MVQKKVPNKLGIQADDHVKSEKLLGNLKPSDGRNRGADLKKKMKKSRSFKRSREVPSPLDVSVIAATPKKQSPAKAMETSPNYMKSTSSYDAKKEHNQVSSLTSQIAPYRTPRRKNSTKSKLGLVSGLKPTKTLVRSSSLKLMRTLTKPPSFKPARASSKKCSPVALCENLDVQRATCSSTLKDSKFPAYLELNHGGTESEGTSVIEVCPYTYCSLNGHHHPPLPPLKCFLSAKRRVLKNQKSLKLGCLSPCQTWSLKDDTKDSETELMIFDAELPIQALDSESPAIIPMIKEEQTDFFVEIYAKESKLDVDIISSNQHKWDNHDKADFSLTNVMPSSGGDDETVAKDANGQEVESLSDKPPFSEIDLEDNLSQNDDVISMERGIVEYVLEEDQEMEDSEVYSPILAGEEATSKCLSDQEDDFKVERAPSIQQHELDSEGSDIEWEAGEFFASNLDVEISYSVKTDSKPDLERGSLEVENHTSHDELVFKSDEIVGTYCEEIFTDEVLQEFLDEENVSSKTWFVKTGSQSDGSNQNLESDEYILVSNYQCHDQVSPIYNVFEEPMTTEENDGDLEFDSFIINVIPPFPLEDPTKEPRAANDAKNRVNGADDEIARKDFQLGIDRTNGTVSIKDEALMGHQNSESLQADDVTASLAEEGSDYPHDFTERAQNGVHMDCTEGQDKDVLFWLNVITKTNVFTDKLFDGSLLPSTENQETDNNCVMQEILTPNAGNVVDEQVDATKSLVGPESSSLPQDLSEAGQNMSVEDHQERKLKATAKDGKTDGNFANEGHPAENQNDSHDRHSQLHVDHSAQEEAEDYRTKNFRPSDSMDAVAQTHPGLSILGCTESIDQDVLRMEVKHEAKLDSEDTSPTAKDGSSLETKDAACKTETNSNQELSNTAKTPRWKIRCNSTVEEWEEQRKFNPQEPNYLPVQPGPEAERVDLKHQTMDERKNSEEWMLDYALRQAVTKLAPSRKKKVALLVEAFETVIPEPKYETHRRHSSAVFGHATIIRACS